MLFPPINTSIEALASAVPVISKVWSLVILSETLLPASVEMLATIGAAGAVSSLVTLNWVAAVFALPAASVALLANTSTVTSPSADGVMVAV